MAIGLTRFYILSLGSWMMMEAAMRWLLDRGLKGDNDGIDYGDLTKVDIDRSKSSDEDRRSGGCGLDQDLLKEMAVGGG